MRSTRGVQNCNRRSRSTIRIRNIRADRQVNPARYVEAYVAAALARLEGLRQRLAELE